MISSRKAWSTANPVNPTTLGTWTSCAGRSLSLTHPAPNGPSGMSGRRRTTRIARRSCRNGALGNSGNSGGSGTNGSGLTREELETALKQRDALTLNITKQMGRLASRHAAKFGEELDVDAIEKIAIEKGMRVEQAYDEWIKPRIEAKAKADAEASVKEAYERGLKEGMSKHDVPLEASKGHHVFFDRKAADPTKPISDRDRAANFVNAWREA